MYIPAFIILVFFAVIGLAAFIGNLVKANMKTDTDGLILILTKITEDNAEAKIRTAEIIRQDTQASRVVCICDRDNGARLICEKLQKEHPYLEIAEQVDIR